jgi:predicted dehydrogenase
MNDTIRVGIVGAGDNTRQRHIPGLRAMDAVEVVSVVNRSRESSERVAAEFNIPTVYDDWRTLVNADDTNAIMIGTWPYLHHPVTLAALDAGKHVLVEARMAMNARQAHEMYAASLSRPDLVTQIVPSPMTLHVDQTIKRLLADGYIGEVVAAEARINGGLPDFESALHWRHDMDLSGLNMMSMGIWYEAILRWLGAAADVTAVGKTVVKSRQNAGGQAITIRIPDHLNIIANMVSGAQLSITLSQATAFAGSQGVWLYGTDGTLHIGGGKLYGARRGDDDLAELDIPAEMRGGWRVEEEFARAIRGLEPITHTTFADGVKYMEFTEAVQRSMANRCMVSLPLLDV